MASLNKIILIGNLGANPETKFMPSGEAVTSIRVATTDRYKDKTTGEPTESTEWHSVQFFGKLAEIAGQYLSKGSQVYIEGSLRTRKYLDKNGVEKLAVGIRATELKMLGSRVERQEPAARTPTPAPTSTQPKPSSSGTGFDDMDDDIPF